MRTSENRLAPGGLRSSVALRAAVLGLAALIAPAFGQPRPAAPTPGSIPSGDPNYRLNAGDVIEIHFAYDSEMNQRLMVRPDGFISLQLLGDMQVLRMSPANLAARLKDAYGKYYRHPDLTISVVEYGSQRAFVGGEVNTPGVVTLRGPINCLQAVLQSGGPKSTAKLDSVLLIRQRDDNVAEVTRVDLKGVMAGRRSDIMLKPYDVVIVPRSRIAKVDLFVEHYLNALVPRNLLFPYNLNTVVAVP